jgi:hypothetical protein
LGGADSKSKDALEKEPPHKVRHRGSTTKLIKHIVPAILTFSMLMAGFINHFLEHASKIVVPRSISPVLLV